jgi:hypothetical protein
MPLAQELDDATLQGVSDEVDPDVAIERPKSPRELAMEAMGAARLAGLEAELGTKLGYDEDEDDDEGDEPEVQLNAQLAADDVITEVEGRKVRVKVDGVERDIDLADAIKQYQKGSAADKRLEEATRLLREAEERARQAAPAPAYQPATPESVIAPDAGKTNLKEALEKLYLGDSDEAVSVITQLIDQAKGGAQPTQQAPQINIDAIAEQLQQRLAIDTALATVRTDYPDIIANKDIELLTAIKVDQLVAGGAPRAAAILDAAKEVYTNLGKAPLSQGRPANTQRESKQEKLMRKASLDPLPTANVADASDEPSYPTTPSSLIQEMAARRIGQGLERLQR